MDRQIKGTPINQSASKDSLTPPRVISRVVVGITIESMLRNHRAPVELHPGSVPRQRNDFESHGKWQILLFCVNFAFTTTRFKDGHGCIHKCV